MPTDLDVAFFDRLMAERDKRIEAQFTAAKEAVSIALAEKEKAVLAALAAAEKAVLKSEQANDKKFDNANEWRGQSADRERSQAAQIALLIATLLPRENFEQFKEGYDETVAALRGFQSRILGALAFATVLIPGVTGLFVFFITH